jgi:hypothetical protein
MLCLIADEFSRSSTSPQCKRERLPPCFRWGLVKPEQIASRRKWRWWLLVLVLGTYLLFCHGCHGNEDNELLLRENFVAMAQ